MEIFKRHSGTLRTAEALALGIHPRTLYALHNAGRLERLSRGLCRLTHLAPLADPDLVVVARRVPGIDLVVPPKDLVPIGCVSSVEDARTTLELFRRERIQGLIPSKKQKSGKKKP